MRAWLMVLAALASNAAFAQNSTSINRYQLVGSGTLRTDSPLQSGGKLTVRATLQSEDASIAAQPPVQEGGRFALMAAATAASNVCYNDTIFRDDFDGDGF